ncbi:SHOCT domain-containing protein [Arthrobacter cheniae]|uniref:SHOCT domain-containing protein n=2 Tax=Arthrobacter cheniae TaxID=1258888 RepID=A0A3A5M0G4_9MICC|nr:SHOCT domain-containing protein [Arthrobacter cheniae]
MNGGAGMGGIGGMGFTWIFGLLMIVGLIVLVVVLVKTFTGGSSTGGASTTERPDDSDGTRARSGRGREILAERYARGELSAEEYRERLRTLEEDGL